LRDTEKISGDENSEGAEESFAKKKMGEKKHKCVKDDTSSFSRVPFFSLYYLSFKIGEVCVRGGAGDDNEFFVVFYYYYYYYYYHHHIIINIIIVIILIAVLCSARHGLHYLT